MEKVVFYGRVFNSNNSLVNFVNHNEISQNNVVSINTSPRESFGESHTNFYNYFIIHFYHNKDFKYDLFYHLDQERQLLLEDIVNKFKNENYQNVEDLLFPVGEILDPMKKVDFESIKKFNEGTWWIPKKR